MTQFQQTIAELGPPFAERAIEEGARSRDCHDWFAARSASTCRASATTSKPTTGQEEASATPVSFRVLSAEISGLKELHV